MKTKLTKIIAICLISIFIAFLPVKAFAECASNVCTGDYPDAVKSACGCPSADSNTTLPNVVVGIINAVILVLGIVAVIFIIIGGVGYMTSSGDAGKVKKAKDTILYACIGLVVCALAFAIVNFTIGILNNTKTDEGEEGGFIHKNNIAYIEKSL